MIAASRPRLVGIDRMEAVSTAVDSTRRLGALDDDDALILATETEIAMLAVLELADQLVLFLIDCATLEDRLNRMFPGPERTATLRRLRNLKAAIAVQRKRLRLIGRTG